MPTYARWAYHDRELKRRKQAVSQEFLKQYGTLVGEEKRFLAKGVPEFCPDLSPASSKKSTTDTRETVRYPDHARNVE